MEKAEKLMRDLYNLMEAILEEECEEKMGFALIVFPFGKEQIANYISNVMREDMIKTMRETADRLEKKEDMPPTINRQMI